MAYHEIRHPRVFIPNKSYHDFSDAKRFGELVFLTEGTQHRFKINDLYRRISTALADAGPGDYLLVSGPTTVNLVIASILAHRFGRLNFLVYDAYEARYVSRPIVLTQTEEGNASVSRNDSSSSREPHGSASAA